MAALFAAALSAHAADLLWYVITDTNLVFEKDRVELLVATDASTTFALVAGDGTVLAEGVGSIRFEQRDPTGVSPLAADGHDVRLLGGVVSSQLVLTGAKGNVSVYAADGALLLTIQAADVETRLDVHTLPQGIYVVKCGRAAFKFTKI